MQRCDILGCPETNVFLVTYFHRNHLWRTAYCKTHSNALFDIDQTEIEWVEKWGQQ